MMDTRTLEHLDFFKILSIFEEFCKTPGGKKAVRRLTPGFRREEIEEIYGQSVSLREIVSEVGACPLEGVPPLEETLSRLRVAGVVLDAEDLLNVASFIGKIKEIGLFFRRAEEKSRFVFPPIRRHWGEIPGLFPLKTAIEKAIDPTGYIRDHASPRLKGLRQKAERQKKEIQTILERLMRSRQVAGYLTDQYLTIRNGRYVLPVKAEAKNAIPGIIHDQSQSRLTFFIEPIACVERNNALSMMEQEIVREEEAIRRRLSQKVGENLPTLRQAWRMMVDLDLIHARVLYMQAYEAAPVNLRNIPGFSLKRVRHPVLLAQKGEAVVPIDLTLPEEKRILILSGVNAGGKTVTLKTLGAVILMVKAGLPVPAAPGGEVYPYEEVFTEIGDEQSLADDLSTFTAHVRHLQRIIQQSSRESLVLIDEIGAGTGMSEGAALALGMLDIMASRQATIMVTTHFELLKAYGAQNPLAMNVSVAFDMEKLLPLFSLCYGIPGNSNAFETARRHGLDAEVMAAAERYRQYQDRLLTDLMSELEGLKGKAEREKSAISDLKREIHHLRDQYMQTLEEITQKKSEVLKKAQEKWELQIKKQRQTFQEFMRRVKSDTAQVTPYHALYSRVKGEFNRMTRTPFSGDADLPKPAGGPSLEAVSVGDEVYLPTLGVRGRVVGLNLNQGMADVMIKGVRLQISIKRLGKRSGEASREPAAARAFIGVDVVTEARPELNVVGYRIQEALPEVDKFIDAALVNRMKEVTIIHGIGTGRLRRAIREYLSKHEGIKTFKDGDIRRGGRGITVVQLS